jgi:hypothetical protein
MRAKVYEKIIGLLVEDEDFRKMYGKNPVAAANKHNIKLNSSEVAELSAHRR